MTLRSLIMQLLPTVIGAYVEFNFVRGWITALEPSVMRFVPVRDAFSAMTRVDARDVGVLGPEGILETRLDDDIVIVLYYMAVWL